ncbi:MAG: ROK family protein [Anaerolineae bacterium]|nr:ROK family protein [Anaerolineae bacterium]
MATPVERRGPHFAAGQLAIGVDAGATKIAAALVTAEGEVAAAEQLPTRPERGAAAVLDDMARLMQPWLAEHDAAIRGVGIGTPGQVNSDAGIVRNAVNLGWDEVALSAEIKARLGYEVPVWVQKDANASALGEYIYGAAQGYDDFVYIGVGSGLGGGVVAGGRLITGANWNAAELGHLSLDPEGAVCNCGNRGCAETVVSGPGLVALAGRYLGEARFASGLAGEEITTEAVLREAAVGDELALAALSEVGRHLGIVIAACVAILNPALIVLGGGLGLAAFDFLVPPARAELARRTLAASADVLAVLPSQVASSAVGAASLVWYFDKLRADEARHQVERR